MAKPHNALSTSSFILHTASYVGEEGDRSARDEGIAISFQTSACSTASKSIEPASIPLPAPDEAEKVTLSMHSG